MNRDDIQKSQGAALFPGPEEDEFNPRQRISDDVTQSCELDRRSQRTIPLKEQSIVAVLIRFSLKTHTINDDKDHDTGIFVEVHDKNGNRIGYIENAARSDNESPDTHYLPECDPNKTHEFSFAPLRDDIQKDDCLPCSWIMGIKASGPNTIINGIQFPGGNDRWTFDAWLFLIFSDDTSDFGDKLGQTLESNGHQLTWDGPSFTRGTPG